MDALLNMIEALGIQLEITRELPKSVNGFYYRDESHDIIVVNEAIKSEAEFKTILSHELGHYFTTGITFKSDHFMDLIHTERDEVRAIRWACDYLIDTSTLIKVLDDATEIALHPLADYFKVSSELMKMKFYFMSLISDKWQLSSSKVLLLSTLPSIYVVEGNGDKVDDALWCSEKVEVYLQNSTCYNIKVMYKID